MLLITEACHPSQIIQTPVGPGSNQMHHLPECDQSWARKCQRLRMHNSFLLPSQIKSVFFSSSFKKKSLHRSRFWCRMSDSPPFCPSSSESQGSSPQADIHTCDPCGTSCQQMAESQVLRCLRLFCFNHRQYKTFSPKTSSSVLHWKQKINPDSAWSHVQLLSAVQYAQPEEVFVN